MPLDNVMSVLQDPITLRKITTALSIAGFTGTVSNPIFYTIPTPLPTIDTTPQPSPSESPLISDNVIISFVIGISIGGVIALIIYLLRRCAEARRAVIADTAVDFIPMRSV